MRGAGKRLVVVGCAALALVAACWLAFWASRPRASSAAPTAERQPEPEPDAASLTAPAPEPPEVLERASVDATPLDAAVETPTAPEEPGAPPTYFYGQLVDGESERPIADGYAFLRSTDDAVLIADETAEDGAVRSDAEGIFALSLARHDGLGLAWASAEGYGSVRFVFDDQHESREKAERIALLREAELEITVLDASSAPVEGAAVALAWPRVKAQRSARFIHSNQARTEAQTGADGLAIFAGLPAECVLEWSVGWTAEESDYSRSDRLALAPGERRTLTVVLGGGARLRGTVRDESGAFVPELELWLARPDRRPRFREGRTVVAQGTSDALGRFELVDLPYESLVLGPAPGQGDFLPFVESVLIDDPAMEMDLVVKRGLSIEGRWEGVDQPQGLEVWAVRDEGEDVVQAESDAEGRFRLAPLAPGEHVVHGGMDLSVGAVRAMAGATDVVLRRAEARTIPFHVERVDGEYTIQVVLLGRKTVISTSHSRADFEWPFPLGPCSILATALEGSVAYLPLVEIGPEEPASISLSMEPGATLTILHRAASGVRELRLFASGQLVPLPSLSTARTSGSLAGSAETFAVPAGPLRAELLEDGAVVASDEVVLQPGERRRLVLEVP